MTSGRYGLEPLLRACIQELSPLGGFYTVETANPREFGFPKLLHWKTITLDDLHTGLGTSHLGSRQNVRTLHVLRGTSSVSAGFRARDCVYYASSELSSITA